MKQQFFWILNAALLIIMLSALLFTFFATIKLPRRQSIEPIDIAMPAQTEELDLEQIYKNDLFKTFQPVIAPIEQQKEQDVIPAEPSPVSAQVPEQPEVQFFDPLNISLTGIIVQEDDTKNIAIILDNKTQQQINYKVGDEIEDAQIIRILKDKIILMRSNGQQEILYTRQDDAKNDNPEQKKLLAKDAVIKIDEYTYNIDPKKFLKSVSNLSQAIDAFDLSTAYRKGVSIGVKVGRIDNDSIGDFMGLVPGDIIETVDDVPTNNTNNKLKIYKKIISKQENDIITVELLRNNMPLTITYKLRKIDKKRVRSISGIKTEIEKQDEDRIEANKIKILHEKYQFAPTIEQLRAREKQNMFKPKTIARK